MIVQSLFGKMMNTLEELDAAADAFAEQYLLDSAVYDATGNRPGGARQFPVSQRALEAGHDGAASGSEHAITVNTVSQSSDGGAADATVLPRDQEDSSLAAASGNKQQPHKGWFGGKADEESDVRQSAGWLKQCR